MIRWADLNREQRLEIIAPKWRDGLSASEIAKLFVGCTRNAVIGYCHREGLTRSDAGASAAASNRARARAAHEATKPKVAKPKPVPRRARPNNLAAVNAARRAAKPQLIIVGSGAVMEKEQAPPPRVATKPDAFAPLPGSEPKLWLERAFGECAWPVGGEGADALSCCLPVSKGSWCIDHARLGFQKPADAKRWDDRLGISKARRAA